MPIEDRSGHTYGAHARSPERLNDLLVLLAVFMSEAGGGLSLAIGMALSGPTGRAAGSDAPETEARTPAAAVADAKAAQLEQPRTPPMGHARRRDGHSGHFACTALAASYPACALVRMSVVAVSIAAAFARPPDALPRAAVTLYAPDRVSATSEISAADHRRDSTLRIRAGHERANTMATARATPESGGRWFDPNRLTDNINDLDDN